MLYKAVLTFGLVKFQSATVQMKAIEQYFSCGAAYYSLQNSLVVRLCYTVQTGSVDQILKREHLENNVLG